MKFFANVLSAVLGIAATIFCYGLWHHNSDETVIAATGFIIFIFIRAVVYDMEDE